MSRYTVGQRVHGITTEGDVSLKVRGFHKDGVIVEVLRTVELCEVDYVKGEVFVMDSINLIEDEGGNTEPSSPINDAALAWYHKEVSWGTSPYRTSSKKKLSALRKELLGAGFPAAIVDSAGRLEDL